MTDGAARSLARNLTTGNFLSLVDGLDLGQVRDNNVSLPGICAMSDSAIISGAAGQCLTRLKIGLAIGFGMPFALGIAYQVCALLGWSIDFNSARLLVELGVLGTLLMLTLQYERLPLGSLGIHKIRIGEIYFGLAVGMALIALSAAVAELMPHRGATGQGDFANLVRAMAPADSSGLGPAPIWLALLMIIASALAEELVARGYAIRRLRAITGTPRHSQPQRLGHRHSRANPSMGLALRNNSVTRRDRFGSAICVATAASDLRRRASNPDPDHLSCHSLRWRAHCDQQSSCR